MTSNHHQRSWRGIAGQVWMAPKLHYDSERWLATAIYDKEGEFVGTFHLAAAAKGPNHSRGDAYLRFIPRTEMDIAVVGCGIALTVDGSGVVTSARVGLGAVAPRPLLVQAAGSALINTKLEAGALAKMIAAVRAACVPIDDKRGTIAFRTEVAGVIARRTAELAYARAMGKAGAKAHD